MITLSVDAMGGDVGLDVTVPAAVRFLARRPEARLIMVGDESRLHAALAAAQAPLDKITVRHATQVVEMDEAPQSALKNKKDSSMRVAIEQVKAGEAQAAVSAGNTGALMATARFVLKTLPGIERPAIAKFLPGENGHLTLALDLGANIDCSAAQIVQFAAMGSELVKALGLNANPRVGLLNIGTEEIKGTEVVKQTFALLRQSSLNFVGNVEADSLFSGAADVIAADGFVGNIVLKTIESSVKFMGASIREEFNRFDPRRYNGAIFLGLRGVVIKSHGGTDATGFAFALEEAYHEAEAASIEKISQGVADSLAALAAVQAEQAAGEV